MLKPGGKLVFTVIGTVENVDLEHLGSFDAFMSPARDYFAMVTKAGFTDVRESDVTAAFRATAVRWLSAAADLDDDLRSVLGDTSWDDKLTSRRDTFDAIEAGEIRRLLISATA